MFIIEFIRSIRDRVRRAYCNDKKRQVPPNILTVSGVFPENNQRKWKLRDVGQRLRLRLRLRLHIDVWGKYEIAKTEPGARSPLITAQSRNKKPDHYDPASGFLIKSQLRLKMSRNKRSEGGDKSRTKWNIRLRLRSGRSLRETT